MALSDEIKQSKPFDNPVEQALVNIIFTNNHFTFQQKKILKKFKLSLETYNVLRILRGQSPRTITVKGITERMLDKMSNASRLVDTLYEAGLVERKNSSEDRRAVEVSILKSGLDLLSKAEKALDGFLGEQRSLTPDELKTLNGLLDRFRNNH